MTINSLSHKELEAEGELRRLYYEMLQSMPCKGVEKRRSVPASPSPNGASQAAPSCSGSLATAIIQCESKILFQQEKLKQQRASCHCLWTSPGEAEMVCLMPSLIIPGTLWLIKCSSFVTNSCWAQHLIHIYGWPVGCNNDWTIHNSPNHVNSFLCVPVFPLNNCKINILGTSVLNTELISFIWTIY